MKASRIECRCVLPSFHLSLPVRDLEESVEFFEQALQAKVTLRAPSGYVNLDLFGTQITLKEDRNIVPAETDLHFGVNLPLDAFEQVARTAQHAAPKAVVAAVTVVDAGTPLERWKLYLRCPTGYLFEFKGYPSPAAGE